MDWWWCCPCVPPPAARTSPSGGALSVFLEPLRGCLASFPPPTAAPVWGNVVEDWAQAEGSACRTLLSEADLDKLRVFSS